MSDYLARHDIAGLKRGVEDLLSIEEIFRQSANLFANWSMNGAPCAPSKGIKANVEGAEVILKSSCEIQSELIRGLTLS
jgi:hypothetical protein